MVEKLCEPIGRLPHPSLDLNPVLWREWHRSRPTRWARIVSMLYVAIAATFSLLAIRSGSRGVAAWVNGLQVSVGLLLLSVTAATSLAEERVRGSLDVLLATPLSTGQIVLGKWLGSFRRVSLLAILPTVVILGGGGPWVERWTVAFLIIVLIVCNGAAITSLGLAMATWSSRLGRAVGVTVTLHVLVTVGWLFLVMMLGRGPASNEGPMMGSPFFWAGELTFEISNQRPGHIGWAIFWATAYAFAAVVLLAATLATFNRCLGRVESRLPPFAHPGAKAVKPASVEEVVGESCKVA
jgi:ABC-type transport system involved in multi-copper enzyme maturation permease subunit